MLYNEMDNGCATRSTLDEAVSMFISLYEEHLCLWQRRGQKTNIIALLWKWNRHEYIENSAELFTHNTYIQIRKHVWLMQNETGMNIQKIAKNYLHTIFI